MTRPLLETVGSPTYGLDRALQPSGPETASAGVHADRYPIIGMTMAVNDGNYGCCCFDCASHCCLQHITGPKQTGQRPVRIINVILYFIYRHCKWIARRGWWCTPCHLRLSTQSCPLSQCVYAQDQAIP